AWLSEASGHSEPATAARLTIPPCSARNATRRCDALGTLSSALPQNRPNPPSSATMKSPSVPGRDSNIVIAPLSLAEVDDLSKCTKLCNHLDRVNASWPTTRGQHRIVPSGKVIGH